METLSTEVGAILSPVQETCLQECFASLSSFGTIRRLDTTPLKALHAYRAHQEARIVGYHTATYDTVMSAVATATGAFQEHDTDDYDMSPNVSSSFSRSSHFCVQSTDIADNLTCPPGVFRLPSDQIASSCQDVGLDCYESSPCICNPCVEAFEVEVFPTDRLDTTNSSSGGVGLGCGKFDICGTVQQTQVLSLMAF